mgnify:CR=1 FL=1
MADLPRNPLAKRIIRNYLMDKFAIYIIYAEPRIGKSAYGLKTLGDVYDYLKGRPLSPALVKDFVGWRPAEVVDRWLKITKRIPAYMWDDAGVWLFSLNWSDPLLIAIQKYFNLIGTDMNSLILTTPDPRFILSKILKMPGVNTVKIIRPVGSETLDNDTIRFSRRAIGYKPYTTPDFKKHGVNTIFEWDFSCKIPQDTYDYYYPERIKWAGDSKDKIKDLLTSKAKTPSIDSEALKDFNDMVESKEPGEVEFPV